MTARGDTDLESIQRTLAELFRRGSPVRDDDAAAALATEIASGNGRLSAADQVDVYREQFQMRHLDVLREDFLTLEHALGDDAFEVLATSYLKAFPPRSFSLRDLGAELPRFLADTAPWSADPLLADLARLEWAFVEAFDAPDAPSLDLASVAAIPEDAWPSVRLSLQPSLQRLALAYPVHESRLAVRSSNDAAVSRPAPSPTFLVVHRGAARLQCVALERDAYALLDELARGAPLGEACERVASASGATAESFEAKVGGWFQEWTALGWLSRVELG